MSAPVTTWEPLPSSAALDQWRQQWLPRTRPYGSQHADGAYRWVYAVCEREVLAAHLAGEVTIAVASLDARGWCVWACLDADAPGPGTLPQLQALAAALAAQGVPALVEPSRRGGHVWFPLDQMMPAGPVRFFVTQLVRRLAADGLTLPDLELYPDTSQSGVLGHAVRLPLGIHRLTGQRYPLLDAQGHACPMSSAEAALSWLLAQPRVAARRVQDTYAHWDTGKPSGASAGAADAADAAPRVLRLAPQPMSAQPRPAPATPAAAPGHSVGTRSAVMRWVDAHISPIDLLLELAPAAQPVRKGRGWLAWCPFHEDAAPQEDGAPGTPSLYLIHNARYGWSWRCFSSQCGQHDGPMRHSFALWRDLLGLDTRAAIRAAARRWTLTSE